MDTPFALYLQMRESGETKPWLRHPYQLLTALRAWKEPRFAKTIAPLLAPTGRALFGLDATFESQLLNVAASCQLTILWAALAEKNQDPTLACAASTLANFLFPIVSGGLMTLWTLEEEHREEEDRLSSHLFFHAVGRENVSLPASSLPLPSKGSLRVTHAVTKDDSIGYELKRSEGASLALTTMGCKTGAGAACIGEVEIKAFGPHLAPLSDATLFGISSGEAGWFCAHAAKEVWLKLAGSVAPKKVSLAVDCVGVSLDRPLAFVFYVKAEACQVEGRVLKPKSLARFMGEADKVEFFVGSSKISFTSQPRRKIEVIPLAGVGAFWGASFLLAVWLPPFQGTSSFQFE